jgi:hypothetical protein
VVVEPGTTIPDYAFIAYVDGYRFTLAGVQCAGMGDPAAMSCSAAIPLMAPGFHELALTTILGGVESALSPRLLVDVVGTPGSPVGGIFANEPPTDIARLPDGRLIVTERDGRVRIIAIDGTEHAALALPDVDTTNGLGLLGVAVHPDFANNRYVYLVYVVRYVTSGYRDYRVIRTREVGNTLGEIAMIVDDIPTTFPGGAAIRFGPDGKMYVAFGEYSDGNVRGLHPYNGSVVRLEDTGLTPRDSPAASPIYVRNIGVPRGFAWLPNGEMWIASRHRDGLARLHHVGIASYVLPLGTIVGGVAAVRSHPRAAAELWVGRLDRDGVQVVPPNRADIETDGAIGLQYETEGRTGCVVDDPNGGAWLCVSDAGGARRQNGVAHVGGQ